MTLIETRAAATAAVQWWRNSVIYQLYVKSFSDSDGDGVGDLDGITARLDHIASLGVDGIWLNPCYPSPNRDGGYDISDYTEIDSRYGGLAAFERLLTSAHARGLKLLMDLVPNHCSADHVWFQQATASGPGSRERNRFIFRDGLGPDGGVPPNNWRSTFGGPAWTRLTSPSGEPEQWYLHSFDSTQPDFNWESANVIEMFDDVLRTWFNRGIDGFRIDVAYAMVKHAGLPDVIDPDGDNPYLWNQPGVHDIFRRWRAIADSYDRELTLVGEVWLPPLAAADYIKPGELKQVFYFDLLQQPFEARAFRTSVSDSLAGLVEVDGVPTWTLNSHDVHRSVTRYGLIEAEPLLTADAHALRTRARGKVDVALGVERAKASALMLLALPGSVYLYQGEELGLPEVQDMPGEARQDPIWERSGHLEYGRDGSRVPLPWSESGSSFGFSAEVSGSASGSASEPCRTWLPQPSWFGTFAVDAQQDRPDSVLAFYRDALRQRRRIDATQPLRWLNTGRDDVLAFERGDLISVTVFDGEPFAPPPGWGRLLCRSDRVQGALLPSSGAWFGTGSLSAS
ncbi:MAG: glycoside hydrolase family 13 protein [Dermatophilaceae bacterium]